LKNNIAIYGAGGFGREMAAMIRPLTHGPLIGFFDDGIPRGTEVDGLPVLGGIFDLNSYASALSLCVAVAAPRSRSNLIKKITNPKIDFPVLVHPSAILGDVQRNQFGQGAIVAAGSILTTGIVVGEFCILNLACTIGHDVTIGPCSTLMPACSISGNVSIGAETVVGTGARIIQGITIGDHCMIGAGAVVTKSFGSDLKLLGVPARKRSNHVEGV
jgi:sugar O-acyltransferase (sialic acid O-acetyltransferase NeuD family)